MKFFDPAQGTEFLVPLRRYWPSGRIQDSVGNNPDISGGDGLEMPALGFDDLQTAPQPTLGSTPGPGV